MLDSAYKDPAPHGEPELVIGHSWIPRVLVAMTLLPASILLAMGAASYGLAHEYEMTVACAVLALFAIGATLGLWWHESGRELRVYENGIEQQYHSRRTYLRWEEIQEVWLRSARSEDDGTATASGAAKLVGNGGTIATSALDRGSADAVERTIAEVAPRMVAHAVERVRCGSSAPFGKASVGPRGIALAGDAFVPVAEVEKLELSGGKLSLKKKGGWLAAASVPVASVPNVHALLGVCHILAGGTPPPAVAALLARSRYV